ncbi:hypothetical protein LZC95_08295 [Pendulispora brunnea]|uniref:Uncharacterized protein n=1 Tax=Pendulispora brunnea TaxID=2905690 RepID=A0ABZ2KGY5_9BACT
MSEREDARRRARAYFRLRSALFRENALRFSLPAVVEGLGSAPRTGETRVVVSGVVDRTCLNPTLLGRPYVVTRVPGEAYPFLVLRSGLARFEFAAYGNMRTGGTTRPVLLAPQGEDSLALSAVCAHESDDRTLALGRRISIQFGPAKTYGWLAGLEVDDADECT